MPAIGDLVITINILTRTVNQIQTARSALPKRAQFAEGLLKDTLFGIVRHIEVLYSSIGDHLEGLDNTIRERPEFEHLSDKNIGQFRDELKKAIQNTGLSRELQVPRPVLERLTNENYHSLVQAIQELGFGKLTFG